MSISELIADVEDSEKTLIVHNADSEAVETVRAQFADRNVTVTRASTASGPPGYVVLSEGDRVVTATSLSDVVPDGETSRTAAFAPNPYRPILDELDETTFTSYDPEQMLAASREIEDRAWRSEGGRLYAGFQRFSVFETQRETYEKLGAKPGLDVTVFGHPDVDLSDHEETFAVCPERADEIRDTWFVAYDGGGDPGSKCALLAEEREPRRFYGVWTYDPETVDAVFAHVEETYLDGASDTRRTADP